MRLFPILFCRPVLPSLIVSAFLLGAASVGQAAVVSLVGDRDCFGLGGICPDGPVPVTLPVQGATDPAFMDVISFARSPDYNHAYDLTGQTPTGAALEIRTSQLADNRGPWGVFFNGAQVGSFLVQSGDFVVTYVFSIALDLLSGNDRVVLAINEPEVVDGYIIDYSQLTIETQATDTNVSQVPLPAALPLFLSALGLLGLGFWRRKRV